jgi:transcriptional regulator with XRE-family HTH domain
MAGRENKLGEYLKARRAQISPDKAGLLAGGGRRVPGLRREEVAELAGLSADYYTRLEQGRERHPSASILNSLARTLGLGPDAQRYLFAIAAPRPRLPQPHSSKAGHKLAELIEQWDRQLATLTDETCDVVAANSLSWAVYGGHQYTGNHARLVFLDPDRDVFFREWDKVASGTVAQLRAAATLDPDNAGLMSLVGELTARSPEFRRRWAKAEVRERTSSTFLVTHAEVGDLDLVYEAFRPNSNPNLLLTVHWPAAGSDTADKLAVLGSRTSGLAPSAEHALRQKLVQGDGQVSHADAGGVVGGVGDRGCGADNA